jgi:hypothetical protein
MAAEIPTKNDWTIMFYFATDNELSLLNVSQIKSVKDAGYQKSTDVLLYFDSNEKGVPTRLFNVNKTRKGDPPTTSIGDGKDPFVRSFLQDEVLPKDMDPSKGPSTAELVQKLKVPDSMTAGQSLANFIGFCRENSPAKHYMLFLVGHGMIVANDTFLPDANPQSAIGLVELGKILNDFKKDLDEGDEFELLGFHSCSMSAIEVACELKDTAKYMIASEGLSYVGTFPYRQLMKKIFNVTEKGLTQASVQKLTQNIYELSLHNAPDFAFCGYSHDLTLCNLASDKIDQLLVPLRNLVDNLKRSIKKKRGKQLILLAHLQSQSFWGESYTDIFDFCRCLIENGDDTDPFQKALMDDCQAVKDAFAPNGFNGLVVLSDNFGWEYQFCRGLSIYFPWSKPLGDVNNDPLKNYASYTFHSDMGEGHSWLGFLEDYWKETMRPVDPNNSTEFLDRMLNTSPQSAIFEAFSDHGTPGNYFNSRRVINLGGELNKPTGGSGIDCGCNSIKNFYTVVKLDRRIRQPSASPRVAKAFDPTDDRPDEDR